MEIRIRQEAPADVPEIEAVTVAAFLNAPHAGHNEQRIVDALRQAGALTLSLVAEAGGVIVGHVAVSRVTISDGRIGWFGLGPVSVVPEFQRRGIGSFLMKEALRILRERGAAGCVLLGDPAYYGRFGFSADPTLILPDVPRGSFQALAFGPTVPRGIVSYHEAFDVP
jgi:putative acetyltransferase